MRSGCSIAMSRLRSSWAGGASSVIPAPLFVIPTPLSVIPPPLFRHSCGGRNPGGLPAPYAAQHPDGWPKPRRSAVRLLGLARGLSPPT